MSTRAIKYISFGLEELKQNSTPILRHISIPFANFISHHSSKEIENNTFFSQTQFAIEWVYKTKSIPDLSLNLSIYQKKL